MTFIDYITPIPADWLNNVNQQIKLITPTTISGMVVVPSIAGLRVIAHTVVSELYVSGYYAPHDGGGGHYTYDPTDTTSADNGGTIIVANDGGRWKLQYTSAVSVRQFGAKGDGITDDLTAFNRASVLGATVSIPSGRYQLSTNPTVGTAGYTVDPTVTYSNPAAYPNLRRGFFTDINTAQFGNGANIVRLNDRVMVGTATTYSGAQNPTSTQGDWITNLYPISGQGAYQYLLTNSTVVIGSPLAQSGFAAYSRTSDAPFSGGGTLNFSSVGVNDNASGVGTNTWLFYGTGVRTATATGNVAGFEMDIANLGATVPIFPAQMFSNGQTIGFGSCAGGELSFGSPVTPLISSAAYTIASNDPTGQAQWEKGIVFHNNGLLKTGGIGIAMALGIGHSINWFDNSNQISGQIYSICSTGAAGNAQKLAFTDNGFLIEDSNANPQFRVLNGISNSANYFMVSSAATAGTPIMQVVGSDTNINLELLAKGTGTIVLGSPLNSLKVNASTVTSATGGSATALPALPVGYITATLNGSTVHIPYYS